MYDLFMVEFSGCTKLRVNPCDVLSDFPTEVIQRVFGSNPASSDNVHGGSGADGCPLDSADTLTLHDSTNLPGNHEQQQQQHSSPHLQLQWLHDRWCAVEQRFLNQHQQLQHAQHVQQTYLWGDKASYDEHCQWLGNLHRKLHQLDWQRRDAYHQLNLLQNSLAHFGQYNANYNGNHVHEPCHEPDYRRDQYRLVVPTTNGVAGHGGGSQQLACKKDVDAEGEQCLRETDIAETVAQDDLDLQIEASTQLDNADIQDEGEQFICETELAEATIAQGEAEQNEANTRLDEALAAGKLTRSARESEIGTEGDLFLLGNELNEMVNEDGVFLDEGEDESPEIAEQASADQAETSSAPVATDAADTVVAEPSDNTTGDDAASPALGDTTSDAALEDDDITPENAETDAERQAREDAELEALEDAQIEAAEDAETDDATATPATPVGAGSAAEEEEGLAWHTVADSGSTVEVIETVGVIVDDVESDARKSFNALAAQALKDAGVDTAEAPGDVVEDAGDTTEAANDALETTTDSTVDAAATPHDATVDTRESLENITTEAAADVREATEDATEATEDIAEATQDAAPAKVAEDATDTTEDATEATEDTTGVELTEVAADPSEGAAEITEDATEVTEDSTATEVTEDTTEISEGTQDTAETPDDATEATEDPTEATEDTTEATEDTTEAAEDTTEAAEDTTESTEDTTDAAEDTTDAAEDATEATEDTTEATEGTTDATEDTAEATEDAAKDLEDASEDATEHATENGTEDTTNATEVAAEATEDEDLEDRAFQDEFDPSRRMELDYTTEMVARWFTARDLGACAEIVEENGLDGADCLELEASELGEILDCPDPEGTYKQMHGEGDTVVDLPDPPDQPARLKRTSSMLGTTPFDSTWSSAELANWLNEIGYSECAEYFIGAGLEAMDLVHLEDADLEDVLDDADRRARLLKRLQNEDVYDFLPSFSCDELCGWLTAFGFEAMVSAVQENELAGQDVLELEPEEIVSFLGLPTLQDAEYLYRMFHWMDGFAAAESQHQPASVEQVVSAVEESMACADLCEWLSGNGLHSMVPIIEAENLDGADVLELTVNELDLLFGVENAQDVWDQLRGKEVKNGSAPFDAAWSCNQVCNWMISEGFGQFIQQVQSSNVTGAEMAGLSPDDMHSLMGYPELEVRQDLMRKVHNRREGAFHKDMTSVEVVAWFVSQGLHENAEVVRVNDLDGMDMHEIELEEISELLGISEGIAANLHAAIHA